MNLPSRIGDARRVDVVLEPGPQAEGRLTLDEFEAIGDRAVTTLTDTYQAPTGASAYVDARSITIVWAMVVRSELGEPAVLPDGLMAEELDPGTGAPETVVSGDVQCRVQNDPVPAGRDLTPADRHVLSCQRSGGGRTVITAVHQGQPTVEYAVQWTNDAWDATGS